jgi:hypothetical protein
MAGNEANARDAEFWRNYLDNPDSLQTLGRHVFRRLPSRTGRGRQPVRLTR